MTAPTLDAIVVGAGPNGLAAAITLARAGRSVRVYEAASEPGGGTRTHELTLPGFRHDMCSTILPLAVASPFFRTVDLAAHGVEIIHPDAPVAHPLDGARAAVLERSVAATAAGLGGDDGRAWKRLFGPLVRDADKLGTELLQPVIHVPRHPLALARFGLPALRSARGLARGRFKDDAGARPVRRDRGACDAAPRSSTDCLVRPRPRHLCPRRRLADGQGRGECGGRRHGRGARGPRWRGRHRPSRALARRPAAGPGRGPGRHAATTRRHRRGSPVGADPPLRRGLSLRLRRLQGGLGARRSRAVGRGRAASGGHGPPRRDARRDRGARRPTSLRAVTPTSRMSCSSSTRPGTRREPPTARPRPGPTAMFRRDPRWT